MTAKDLLTTKLSIAKFDGKTVYPEKIPAKNKQGWRWSYKWKGEYCDYSQHELNYDTDWKMLMPIVEKIMRLKTHDGDTFYLRTFGMIEASTGRFMVRFNRMHLSISESLLTATFNAVAEFVKYYVPCEKL